jgi:hypothetical protein
MTFEKKPPAAPQVPGVYYDSKTRIISASLNAADIKLINENYPELTGSQEKLSGGDFLRTLVNKVLAKRETNPDNENNDSRIAALEAQVNEAAANLAKAMPYMENFTAIVNILEDHFLLLRYEKQVQTYPDLVKKMLTDLQLRKAYIMDDNDKKTLVHIKSTVNG